MLDFDIPNLTFTDVELGARETPWSLLPLLYLGGAAARANKVGTMIADGSLGKPRPERIPLIHMLHETISNSLAGGGSTRTAQTSITTIRKFFHWVDNTEALVGIEQIETTYRLWADHLLHRVNIAKDLSEMSAYHRAALIGALLDSGLGRLKPILSTIRLRKTYGRRRARGVQAEKQNLIDTFAFGHTLLDIADGLSWDVMWGALPVQIPLRTGQILIEHSRRGVHPDKTSLYQSMPAQQRQKAKMKTARLEAYEAERTLRTRHPLANLRIEAEMLIFIGQTGMNMAQAQKLLVEHYSYTSSIDGYHVRSYKNRRGGPVLFEIFGEYRSVFERYLTWRKAVFTEDSQDLLFPFIRETRRVDSRITFDRVKTACKKLGISFIPPTRLRNTRVNWLLRRSRDADLTSEMDQHTKETLLKVYEEPSLQITMSEVTVFWQRNDPTITPPSPGLCIESRPTPVFDIPKTATRPDCITPAGCLWCQHQRDIDSPDYVWSLCSYRYLKTQELALYHPPYQGNKDPRHHPADHAIER
ncbi:MAG: hypothetical protein KGM39_04430, partial [Actinomycetales bacterium]|nr:hypothetical protein [Actinomycetales bacterium]